MNPQQIIPALDACISARIPALLSGAPGIGKSDIVRQIADGRGWPLIDLRLATMDPVDLKGLPAVHDGRAVFAPLGELPDESRDGPNGILFLDELLQAPMAVQNAAFSLVLDRRIGDYVLPDGWHVIAAGNRMEDRAGAGRMNSALANRFAHFTVETSLDAWCMWALSNGIPAELVAFLRFRSELLHAFEPDRVVNATPRTWAMAARFIGAGLPPAVEMDVLAGTIGEGPAAELVSFLQIWRTLPNPDAVLLNPDSADVPEKANVTFALTGALARKVTDATMPAFVRYLSRLAPEYGVVAMKDATTRDKSLTSTRAFVEWSAANASVYV